MTSNSAVRDEAPAVDGGARRRPTSTRLCGIGVLTVVVACFAWRVDPSSASPRTTARRAATTTKRPATATPTKTATAKTATAQTGTAQTMIAKPTTTTAKAVAPGRTSFEVRSTPEQYFVLYFRPDPTSPTEVPVAIARGKAGSTTLTDGRTMLSDDRHRVDTRSVAKPGDVDRDGIDDLTELDTLGATNPLNPAPSMDIGTGAVYVPDRATFETLSYQGEEVARDGYLAGLEFVKFWLVDTNTDNASVYFMNTESYRAHPVFAGVVGIPGGRGPSPGKMRGDIVYDAAATAPDGTKGRYRFAFQPNDAYPYPDIALAYELLVNNMPLLAGKLVYYPFPQSALPLYQQEKSLYDRSRVAVLES